MSILRRAVAASLVALAAGADSILAQTATIPVRSLTASVTTDSGVLRSAPQVRPLPNGNVLANDRVLRRLMLLDSTLKKINVLADTAAGAPNRYGAGASGLVAFTGDSSLFIDNSSQSLIVVDPHGMFGRVMAPPKASDMGAMSGPGAGFDDKGRSIYRVQRGGPFGGPPPREASSTPSVQVLPDSAAIVRADFDTRAVDTLVMFKIPVQKMVTVSPQQGMTMRTQAFNPLPQTDDWTLMPDGTIAIVRGQDYHVDWFKDGKLTSTPKMPFDWKRITQEEKVQLLDSLKAAAAKREADAAANPPAGGRGDGGGGRGGAGGAGGDVRVAVGRSGGVDGPMPSGMPVMPRIPFTTVEPTDMPDYYPPIRAGMLRADRDGNLWILPSTSTFSQGTILGTAGAQTSSLVYDVVGRDGVIKERVKLPPGRLIAAFGPNGVIYLTYSPVPGVAYLERARVNRASGANAQ